MARKWLDFIKKQKRRSNVRDRQTDRQIKQIDRIIINNNRLLG